MTEKEVDEKFDIWRMLNDNEKYGIDYAMLPYLKKFIYSLVFKTRQDTVREVVESYKKGVVDMWKIVCREIGDDEGFNKGVGEIDLDKLCISKNKLLSQLREDYNIKDE